MTIVKTDRWCEGCKKWIDEDDASICHNCRQAYCRASCDNVGEKLHDSDDEGLYYIFTCPECLAATPEELKSRRGKMPNIAHTVYSDD